MIIRTACENLETYDLSGCSIYTSCEPCPMCLSAIIWANIKNVYYACNRKDVNRIWFWDEAIYEFLEGKNRDLLNTQEIDREECLEVFEKYKKKNNSHKGLRKSTIKTTIGEVEYRRVMYGMEKMVLREQYIF